MQQSLKIRVTEPDVTSAKLYFFINYNFTSTDSFEVGFTDMIEVVINIKTGYTTRIYSQFEQLQFDEFQSSKLDKTDFSYDLYSTFLSELDLDAVKKVRSEKRGILLQNLKNS